MFNNVALDPFNDPFTTAATPSLSNLTLNRNNANASTTTQPPGLTGGLGYSGVWNNSATKSRNNTIWNNTGSIWNSGGVNGTSSPNISNTNLNNLSSTNLNNLSATNLNNLSATNLNGTSGLPAPTTTNTDPHIIHSAAVQAFQMLSTSNSLEFGMAKGFTLFQATKNIVPQVSFNFNQFLGALTNTPSAYKFELIYDDFGTVNYIKVADATVNSPYQSSLNINLNGQGPSPTLTTPETTPFRVQNQLPNSQASQPNLSISLAASAAQYTPPRGFWN
ncbi:hypothetical protein CANTEDRAFT_115118 [Yamadazyma tenuis ATCC 10573]|uniref:Uncharacterized protein n=1 Tax=Candida tenuis (strain ATCC 10573 / BCRC 21748 / CBS 615 / JCM 9827 / NBRC 10315 / NRRL Y-1498 / VKM Y-70) TaxID=590646 RepID=G3B7N5_CANTC|nr:uncharacterized protein CANTEDRAFT_115118 [Yamadazyma tenuis ATCC 10573]EGV61657.1 hypothetical protein CANTEDRAFT_115118 [Yamadazyma tenuis ATCC 10573]